jgi:transposase InsO family protein
LDFTSNRLEQVAADLNIRLVFSIPGKPQGRGRVERFFRTINEMFLCDLEGYTKKGRRKPILTMQQLDERFQTFLLEIYHRRKTHEVGRHPIRTAVREVCSVLNVDFAKPASVQAAESSMWRVLVERSDRQR